MCHLCSILAFVNHDDVLRRPLLSYSAQITICTKEATMGPAVVVVIVVSSRPCLTTIRSTSAGDARRKN
jgi:hypothetical protein